ncbi:MAG: hypothetical protein IJI35_18295 [Kiritimatiellae bacterium]|nr:hypothetical protein [Kiritimatiellia bacterium]
MTFGIPHAYSGPEYPLDSPALREGWTKGDSPLTGCSCVPEADFGDGIVVTGRSPPVRSGGGQGCLPDGMRIEWEYEPGGVWATCLAGTNVVWRKWVPHDYLPDYGGRSDGLDGPEEDECGCGDGAEEGPSLGSVRFRIPLGLPYAGITSGFVYFCRTEEFAPAPSSFRLMARGDASVSDTTEDGVRTVVCHDFRGRTLVMTPVDGEDAVEIEVRNAASGESWTVSKFGYPVEEGTPERTFANFYGPVGKVFTRTLACQGESTRISECVLVDALGDELARVVCDRQDIENAPGSEFAYDCRGNRCVVTNAVGAATFTAHDPDGNVVAEDGATYPTEADYDVSGRRVALRTTRGGEVWDETSWAYDAATGACTNKTYADGSQVAYTHTPDGLPLRTTYASGRWRENAYDSRRQLVQVSFSDSSLDYAMVRDVFGRTTNVVDATGREWRYEYDAFDSVLREEVASASLSRDYDSVGRLTGLTLTVNGNPKGGVGYEYAADGMLAAVAATNSAGRTSSVAYSNHAGRCIGYAVTTPGGDTIRRSVVRDFYRQGLVNGCATAFNDESIDSHSYAYDALSRPTARTDGGTGCQPVQSSFTYNDRSEIIAASIGTNHFDHAYDTIGNQTNHIANSATNIYTHNALNQISTAHETSAPSAPLREISHDLDGNTTSDGVCTYSYDAANRLSSVASNNIILVANQYDYKGRRIKKTTPTTETTFIYDGWNLIQETVSTINGATTNTCEIQYFWGADLSESLQGAGGVGGLLAVSCNNNFYFPTYDNNGNITKYIDESGNIVAAYEYDDFGRLISQTGSLADFFRIRFSSKYYGSETGLYYYGYRFYSPSLMRWLNRDPIEEKGGLNLYCFCLNNALPRVDAFGQSSIADYVFGNIGYDRSFPILGPYGIPIPAIAARLQIQIYISGNYAECCKNGKKKKYAKGTVGAEAYLTWGAGTSRQVKGRDRNKPDPYRPGSKMKNNSTNPPDSGYRSRSWHVDGTLQNTSCPESGLHFSGLTGVIFLRGSAGYGAGVQVNIQKEFRAVVDLSRGWSASLNGAWNVWGATIDFGGGGSGSWTYLQD